MDVLFMYALLWAFPNTSGLVLVGDVDQLPSVGPGNTVPDMIESGVVPVVRLTEVFKKSSTMHTLCGRSNGSLYDHGEDGFPMTLGRFHY